MSSTLADAIERHILGLIAQTGEVELQRIEISRLYGCAPSQINYVLATRFGAQHGFVTESRRGGGGYIRIRRVDPPELAKLAHAVASAPEGLSEAQAKALIAHLAQSGFTSQREAGMLLAIVRRDVLAVDLPERDLLRARCLAAAIWSVATGG